MNWTVSSEAVLFVGFMRVFCFFPDYISRKQKDIKKYAEDTDIVLKIKKIALSFSRKGVLNML